MKHNYQIILTSLEVVCKAAEEFENQGNEILCVFPTMQAAPAPQAIATPGQPQMVPLLAIMIRKPREEQSAILSRP